MSEDTDLGSGVERERDILKNVAIGGIMAADPHHGEDKLSAHTRSDRTRPAAALIAALVFVLAVPFPVQAAEGEITVEVFARPGVPLVGAELSADGVAVAGDGPGRFSVVGPADLMVTAPGYLPAEILAGPASGHATVTLVPRPVFGLHVSGEAMVNQWDDLMRIADESAVNAFVIELKDDAGRVISETPSGVASETDAVERLVDFGAKTEEAHAAGVYVIARVVTFADTATSQLRPEWAAWDERRDRPYHKGGQGFLDPWDVDARAYAIQLAIDACEMGADEIQFDYVRFPDASHAGVRFDGPKDAEGRQAAITTFLAEARAELTPRGCVTAAAIFGFITNTPTDGGIGQQLEALAEVTDVLSPMVYPSLYTPGWYGYADPFANPYGMVDGALRDSDRRLAESPVIVRPWIQDWFYSGAQLSQEIRAADEHQAGWMLWNIRSDFSESGIPAPRTQDMERQRATVRWTFEQPVLVPSWFRELVS